MDLSQQFKLHAQKHNLFTGGDTLLLAVSGGMDSIVLCELCKQAGYSFEIGHANFQLRGEESAADEHFVRSLGNKYEVKVHIKRFDTASYAQEHKRSVQVAARELRYGWFNELLLGTPSYLLTAHHADDNIETVLMNFFRGTGIAGLRGILPKHQKIVRPLLPFTREQLQSYAQAAGLAWREDASNESDKYTRNYFRHAVIPVVKKVFPEAADNLHDNISRFRDIETLYWQAIEIHKKKLLEKKGNEIHVPLLKLKKVEPLETILFEILRPYDFSASQLPDALQLLEGGSGRHIASRSHRMFRNRNWLIIAPVRTTLANHVAIEEGDEQIRFEKGSILISQQSTGDISTSPALAVIDSRELQFPLLLRRWKPGDYFYPLGMRKKKKIARFLIDCKLSPVEKEQTWVVESGKKICWVVNLRIDDRFKISPSTSRLIKMEFVPGADAER